MMFTEPPGSTEPPGGTEDVLAESVLTAFDTTMQPISNESEVEADVNQSTDDNAQTPENLNDNL